MPTVLKYQKLDIYQLNFILHVVELDYNVFHFCNPFTEAFEKHKNFKKFHLQISALISISFLQNFLTFLLLITIQISTNQFLEISEAATKRAMALSYLTLRCRYSALYGITLEHTSIV